MPSVRAEQLESQLARGLAPIYVIHGDEPLIALESADAIRRRARASGYAEREVMIVERNFKWGELAQSGASMSLFGEKKLVELRMPGGRPGNEGAAAIEAWCANPSPDAMLMLSLPRLARRDQSSAWFGALMAKGVVVEVWPIDRPRLPEWIAGRLARQKQKASREALQFLADSVEGNLLAAHQEIQKLGLLFPEGPLEDAQVRSAVLNVARFDVDQLGEAMFSGDPARLVRVLDGLKAEGEALPRLLWVLAEDLRALLRIGEGLQQGRPLPEVLRENRVWGEPRSTIMGRAARSIGMRSVEAALSHAARIDRIAKGVAIGDGWDELLALGLALAAPSAPPGARRAAA